MQKKTKRWHLVRNLNRNFGLNLSCRAVIVDIFYIHVYIIVMYIVYMTWFQWLHGSTAKKTQRLDCIHGGSMPTMVMLTSPWFITSPPCVVCQMPAVPEAQRPPATPARWTRFCGATTEKLGLVIVILLMMSYNFLVVSAIACIWKIVFLLFGICKVDTYLYKHLWFVYVIFTSVSNITILVCFLVCLSVFVCLSLSLSVCLCLCLSVLKSTHHLSIHRT